MVEPYRPQIAPQRTAAALPQADARDFGAGVFDAIQQVGSDQAQRNIRAAATERERDQDRQQAQAMADWARTQTEIEGIDNERRQHALPGGAGHRQLIERAFDERAAAFLGTISDEEVRQRWVAQVAQDRARTVTAADAWERGMSVALMVKNSEAYLSTRDNQASRLTSEAALQEHVQETVTALRGLNVDGNTIAQLERQAMQGHALAFLTARPPQEQIDAVNSGRYDAVLTPQQREALTDSAGVEIRREEAAAERRRNAAEAQVREQIQTVKELASQGIDVSAQLPSAMAAAQALGDTSLAAELDGLQANNRYARIYEGQPPVQRERAISRLASIANPSAEQQRELAWLREHSSALDGRFNSDPTGFLATYGPPGTQPPPLDLADPASVQARQEWARAASREQGRPIPVLTGNQARQLAANLTGPNGQLDVANALAQFDVAEARQAARLVAPDDHILEQLVALEPLHRAQYQNGIAARQTRPALVDGAAETRARQVFNARVGRSLANFSEQQRTAMFEISRNLYAYSAARAGRGEFDEAGYAASVEAALGGRIGMWNRRAVLLPPGMTEGQFEAQVARYRPTNGPGAPVFRTGRPMTVADLQRYTPVRRPDGLYEFHDGAGHPVRARSGRVFTAGFGDRR